MDSDFNWFWVFLVVVLIYTSTSPNWSNNTYTVYYKTCDDFKHNSYSCPKNAKINLFDTTYRAVVESQVVVSKNLFKLSNCSVFDKKNWECGSYNAGNSMVMRDGNVWEQGDNSLDEKEKTTSLPRYQQISRLEYNVRSLIDVFK